jgi:hypothetical protein
MSSYSKDKGTGYEREFLEKLANGGIENAERTWGSDGRSRGLHRKVDVVIRDKVYVQNKRPSSVPGYLFPKSKGHIKMLTERSTGDEYAVLWLDPFYIRLLNTAAIDPKVDRGDRKTVGEQWVPSPQVVAQAMREDYDTDGDLVVMRRPTYQKMKKAANRLPTGCLTKNDSDE